MNKSAPLFPPFQALADRLLMNPPARLTGNSRLFTNDSSLRHDHNLLINFILLLDQLNISRPFILSSKYLKTACLTCTPQTPPPHRPDTVSAQLNLSSENIPPVPNYLGNIMVGDSLVPASGSFQCILTLPTSQPLPLNLKVFFLSQNL